MKDRFFNNFKLYFPIASELVTSFKQTGLFDLTIKLNDGTSVMYDDIEHSIRNLPRDSKSMSEKECRREFGLRLRKIMYIKNISQLELSERTGISNVTISNYLNFKATPSFYNVDRIAKALGCSMEDLRYTD